MNDLDVHKRVLARILPSVAIVCCGMLLMLGVALVVLTDGADAVLWLVSNLHPSAQAAVLLSVLGAALAVLGWSGRRLIRWAIQSIQSRQKWQGRGMVDEE